MPTSHPLSSLNTFSRWLVISGLVDEAAFTDLWKEFESNGINHKIEGDELAAFITFIVGKNAVTKWQCKQLLEGRYKGFYLDQYKLVDCLGFDDKCTRYVADDLNAEKKVVLAVVMRRPIIAKQKNYEYTVEEYRPS